MKWLSYILLCGLALQLHAQNDSIQLPMDLPLYLSGTFGEPRGSHFHAGIDIRTNGVTGYDVYTIEDGYIARIKVSATGYGNALYVAHPNGTTSVYAHLEKFSPVIDSFVLAMHYKQQSFELNEYLASRTLKVKKGQVIGKSGNSGGSGGPHLHFEIRDTETQEPMNPHLFGYEVVDNIPPYLSKLYVYRKDEQVTPLTTLPLNNKGNGIYSISGDTLTIANDIIGIGIHTIDKMENSSGSNGIYRLNMRANGRTVYSFNMDRISFSTSRYVLSHIDYYQKLIRNSTVYRCYKLEGNKLNGIYDTILQDGFITVPKKGVTKIELEVSDYEENLSSLCFYIKRGPSELDPPETEPETNWLYCYKPSDISIEDLVISFPASCIYSATPFYYSVLAKPLSNFSNSYEIMEPGIPVHKRFDLAIKANANVPETLKDKALIVRIDEDGDPDPYEANWKAGGWLSCRPRDFGTFYIDIDTISPSVKQLNSTNGVISSKQKSIRFQIADELSGIDSYKGSINGHWVLFKYDAKNDLLYHEFDDWTGSGELKLKLVVIDHVGNETTYSTTLKR